MVKFGAEKIKNFKGYKKWLRYFFLAVASLYWAYIAITIAYWYFLELNSESLDKVIINPVFLWIVMGFFLLLEGVLFKKTKKAKPEVVSIYSNRKKTLIQISNIAYIESRGDFTLVILKDGSQLKNSVKISDWENKLGRFLRIHRSFLVSPNDAILKGNNIIVNGQWELPVSRSYKKKVEGYFMQK